MHTPRFRVAALSLTLLCAGGCGGTRAGAEDAGVDSGAGDADLGRDDAGPDASVVTVHLLPNSHIDAAWLWRWPETIEVVRRTWEHMATRMEEYPQVTFVANSAAYYDVIRRQEPQLFARIRALAAAGRWDVVGGHWVEPYDAHSDGETLIRQYLYGKRFFREHLGIDVRIGFVAEGGYPNHAWPQILRGVGLERLVLGRNDSWAPGRWEPYMSLEGPEGTALPTAMIWHYWQPTDQPSMLRYVDATTAAFGLRTLHYTFGYGDHGLGPLDQELLAADDAVAHPTRPEVRFEWSTASRYFEAVDATGYQPTPLKFPRDTYQSAQPAMGAALTWVETKRADRAVQWLLHAAEAYAALDRVLTGAGYPAATLEDNWKRVLFNQHHDLAWGSGIYETIVDMERDYQTVATEVAPVLQSALGSLAAQVATDTRPTGIPVVVFNAVPRTRDDLVALSVELPGAPATLGLWDETGAVVPAQVVAATPTGGGTTFAVLARLDGVPAGGLATVWAEEAVVPPAFPTALQVGPGFAENQHLRLEFDAVTGCLTSLVEKAGGHETLAPAACGGAFDLMQSGGDQWGFKGDFAEADRLGRTGVDVLPREVVVEQAGPLCATVRLAFDLAQSGNTASVVERVSVCDGLPLVLFDLEIDWQVSAALSLWAAFPTALAPPGVVVAESQLGYQTYGDIPADRPLYSFLVHRFADFSGADAGLGLLTDSRYLFHVSQGTLRLGLVRSAPQNQTPDWIWDQTHPYGDPPAFTDGGVHRLRFAIFPHGPGWVQAGVHERGEAFSSPLLPLSAGRHPGTIPPRAALLGVEPSTVMVSAVKQAEDGDALILRVYNLLGAATTATVTLPAASTAVDRADLMEWSFTPTGHSGRTLSIPLGPYAVETLRISF
ncbi:MAG: hypothetical protein HY906_24045 [Deltaproteobacteria bacterium]|nr:hypothetical protein [Deltaproteobacteria bacterium]